MVIAVIAVLTSGAITFFFGRLETARRLAVTSQLAEAIENVQQLPDGNPFTWQATAQNLIADVMDADPPAADVAAGTSANLLSDGLHAGRTLVDGEALMRDPTAAAVTLAGCVADDLQLTLHPASFPADNALRDVDAHWLMGNLQTAMPQLIVVEQRDALFCCLPAS
ncbi:MAG: hypothetical protein F4Y00_07890 [Bacteroidetes bacterium SB0662_bin_6]|nr:hypothetical protein [Bacteroidetes bacterium SB0662_bin_6]